MSLVTHALTPEDLTAQKDRLYASILLRQGVVDVAGGSFEVNEDTGSNLNVRIGSGTVGDKAVVEGDSTADQGNYVVLSQDATDTVTLSAGDSSNPRIDRVGILVQDDEADSSGQSQAILTVVEGTPSSSPSVPAEPDNFLTLALVEVGTGASAVTDSNITDQRVEAPARGQLVDTVYFTSDGSFAKADYPWLREVRVKVQGGGAAGGGAGTTGSGESSVGEGGGGGEYAEGTLPVSALSTSETVTVGGGGSGGTGVGGFGGNSSFGSHISANGGTGGSLFGASSTTRTSTGPAGGTGGSGGDLRIPGSAGEGAIQIGAVPRAGGGGGSVLAGETQRRASAAHGNGFAGSLYGGGGGGAANIASQGTARAGGNGAGGIVIVELYA